MKTIQTVFLKGKKGDVPTLEEVATRPRYTFNGPDELTEGDVLQSNNYNNRIMVVGVLVGEPYTHYNPKTKDLDRIDSMSEVMEDYYPIAEMGLVDVLDTIVRCKLIV